MYLPIILGTARQGRRSEAVARFMLGEVKAVGLESEIIDVKDYVRLATDDAEESSAAKQLGEKVQRADGFIVVTPEYNHGYPGELKIVLDLLYKEYARKPIGFCGVSNSRLGGARAIEQLRLVAIEFHMVPIREAVYFSQVQTIFDAEGNVTDEAYHGRVSKFLEELLWYAKALQAAREATP